MRPSSIRTTTNVSSLVKARQRLNCWSVRPGRGHRARRRRRTLSGTSIAAKGIEPGIRVIAAEPEMADDAYRSIKEGKIIPSVKPKTIADGLLTSLGTLTFPIIQQNVEQIVTVSERGIIDAMKFVWERAKIVIEPSAAVAVGVVWERKIDLSGLNSGGYFERRKRGSEQTAVANLTFKSNWTYARTI